MHNKGSFMQTKHLCILIHIWTKGEVFAPWNQFKPSSKIFLLTVPRWYFLSGSFSFVLFMSRVCHAFASVHCCHVVTWRERTDLLALVCDVYCDFVTFPFGILGQVCYLIVSIPDHCCLYYFNPMVKIQSSTAPDPGYQWESDNFTIRRHKREPRGQPFPSRWPQGINKQTHTKA